MVIAENPVIAAAATRKPVFAFVLQPEFPMNAFILATEALRIGMLSALVPAAELDVAVDALTQHLLAGGSEAHARIKDLIRQVAARPIDEALRSDTARRIAEIRASPEGKEGIAAFLEKRKPSWKR